MGSPRVCAIRLCVELVLDEQKDPAHTKRENLKSGEPFDKARLEHEFQKYDRLALRIGPVGKDKTVDFNTHFVDAYRCDEIKLHPED